MFSLYIQPAANFLPPKRDSITSTPSPEIIHADNRDDAEVSTSDNHNHRDPIAFLYYSIVLTTFTVIVAIVIGVIQLLSLIDSAVGPKGKFWEGVETASDYYDAIGGGICGCFVIIGAVSVLLFKPWKRWVMKGRERAAAEDEEGGYHDDDFGGVAGGSDLLGGEAGGSSAAGETETAGKEVAASQVSVKPARPPQV